jgi:hypothetical protein
MKIVTNVARKEKSDEKFFKIMKSALKTFKIEVRRPAVEED